jgi:hypothetical protein
VIYYSAWWCCEILRGRENACVPQEEDLCMPVAGTRIQGGSKGGNYVFRCLVKINSVYLITCW